MIKVEEITNPGHNLGLYHGKMGYCLSQFMQAKITASKDVKKSAQKLLNEIGDNISQVKDYSFGNGLLGIGWAIEWIAQQKYLRIDTNVVLEDLDDEIYKLIIYNKAENIGLRNGTLGRILYLYKRMTTKCCSTYFCREINLRECLCLTMDELYDALIVNKDSFLNKRIVEIGKENQEIISQILTMLVKLYPLKFNFIVNELLEKITNRMSEMIADLQDVNNTEFNYYCVNAFLQAGIALNNKVWVRQVKELLISRNITEYQLLNYARYSLKKDPIRYNLTQLSKVTNDYSWKEGWLIS